ncbi:SpoIIE family protein phosphatase [Sporosalibacterium faouarense]|uniref:SpoIIE family protein phosphatase n=1 Tax=Sporosalibacterium faouarense TaxID=516123 RepID=UPI00141C4F64|nr:SpoIIE family protein phosphatase [Sporosalibacterium faouarense]MTI46444.1 PAS domain-containing protein [Bacillota bacterium]
MLNKKMTISSEKIKGHTRLNYDILDGMVDWVRVIDTNNIIIYANKPMKDELGEDIVGSVCYTALGKCCSCKRCITNTTITTGFPSEKEESVGDKIYSVKSSPVKDKDGNIYAAVEVFRDVTRERILEREIKKKNKKMSKDLNFAKTLQEKILPSKGQYDNVNIDYIYRPSEMLSGDIFDIFHIDKNHIGIYISDVVGHGVTSSMMTMFIRQTMKAIKDEIFEPGKALSELHKRFLSLNLDDDRYFTIFYGVLDKRDNIFKYANGGHNSIPILFNKDRFRLLEATGFPISYLFENIEYEEKLIKLKQRDKVVFYTDGIIEAKNNLREQFGLDRLVNIVKNSKDKLINNIEREIYDFKCDEQEDDFAILTMEIL